MEELAGVGFPINSEWPVRCLRCSKQLCPLKQPQRRETRPTQVSFRNFSRSLGIYVDQNSPCGDTFAQNHLQAMAGRAKAGAGTLKTSPNAQDRTSLTTIPTGWPPGTGDSAQSVRSPRGHPRSPLCPTAVHTRASRGGGRPESLGRRTETGFWGEAWGRDKRAS